jgi:hypothetical protein
VNLTLTKFPNGKCILTTPEELYPATQQAVRDAIARWRDTPNGILMLCPVTEVQSSAVGLVETAGGYVIYDPTEG